MCIFHGVLDRDFAEESETFQWDGSIAASLWWSRLLRIGMPKKNYMKNGNLGLMPEQVSFKLI